MPTWAIILLSIYGGVSACVFVVAWWFTSVFIGGADAPRKMTWSECGEAFALALILAVGWPIYAFGAVLRGMLP